MPNYDFEEAHIGQNDQLMTEFLTPKQIARALQVSESSVKRWCDKGVILAQKTAGGHRRVALGSLVEFLRETKQPLVEPAAIGLPALGRSNRRMNDAAGQLTEALLVGDEQRVRGIVLDLYLAETSIATICDEVIAAAFAAIGDRWECGDAEVYQERHGCELMMRTLHELRTFLPSLSGEMPLAIGGTPAGDPYTLPTTMADLVLRDARWRSVSLGSNLPGATLAAAIKQYRPRMFWLSCSHIPDPDLFLREYDKLFGEFGLDVAFVVGGRALNDDLRKNMRYAAFCDNMQHLEAFASTFRNRMNIDEPS